MSNPTIIWNAILTGAHGDVLLTNDYQWGGSQFRLTDIDGWYGGVGVWGEQAQRVINHGLFERDAMRSGRVLTLKGSFLFEDEFTRQAAARYFSSLLWDGRQGALTVTTGDNLIQQAQVRLDGAIGIDLPDGSLALKLSVPLQAADPFIYAPPQRFQIYPAGEGTGLRYPLFKAVDKDSRQVLDWGKGTPVGGAGVNEGNVTAYPTITVRGDWPAGFTITANGKRLTYAAPVHNSTPVVIDCKEGSVLASGMDKTYQLTQRAWFEVAPESVFQPTIRALAPSSGWADIEISSTYI